jgi:hypothetical protein
VATHELPPPRAGAHNEQTPRPASQRGLELGQKLFKEAFSMTQPIGFFKRRRHVPASTTGNHDPHIGK